MVRRALVWIGGILVLVVLGYSAYTYLGGETPFDLGGTTEADRVLIMAATPDDTGALVAQVIAEADLTQSPAVIASIEPSLTVTIPGVTYDALQDAYAFGDGRAVAEAYAGAQKGATEPLPYIAVPAEALYDAVGVAGGITVTVPAQMNVFDGERLFTFEPGEMTITAEELPALLRGAPYLQPRERAQLQEDLAVELARLLATWPGGLAVAVEEGALESDLAAEALDAAQERLADARVR